MNIEFSGGQPLGIRVAAGPHELLAAVLCSFEELEGEFPALLDTASAWSILDADLVTDLGYDTQGAQGDPATIHSRFGRIDGMLVRIPTIIWADEGEPLNVEVTWFASRDWPGPTVFGWQGGLDRLDCAILASAERIYFRGH